MGTPQLLVDGQGNVVWEAVYSAFGEARVDVELVESNLRFAGQYFDVETGLHYNWHRFYDPGLGRYLRSDPIWAVNLYGYANQNPLGFIDPKGQLPIIIPIIWGIYEIGSTAYDIYTENSRKIGSEH